MMVVQQRVDIQETAERRVHLHEVVSENPCTDLGPAELLDVPEDRLQKLCKRFWSLSPEDVCANIHEGARAEYGHLVEVRNPLFSDKLFETITGPFKDVDIRTLHDQIPLSKPIRKLVLRYSSGRKGRLLTLTKLFKHSEDDASSIKQNLRDRSKRYKMKKPKKPAGHEKRSAIVDDDIGDLISKFGDAAVREEQGGQMNAATTVNTMVDKWKEQEKERTVMVYKSGSDSSLSAAVENSERVQDFFTNAHEERRSSWKRLKTICCCWCLAEVSTIQPTQDNRRKKRLLRDGKGSERLWKPYKQQLIHTDRLSKS